MPPKIETCPHCGAPLAITRFATIIVCNFCQATVRIDPAYVSASKYHQAWAEWNAAPDGVRCFLIEGSYWIEQQLLARGEISDVYLTRRGRWPTEFALLKIVRSRDDEPILEHEWNAVNQLRERAEARGVVLGSRVPAPVIKGVIENEAARKPVTVYRWAGGFTHTFEMVRRIHPQGIPPVSAVWVWRRIVEVLAVIRECNLVHGAILPNHLLIENGEHGVRLVGFSCADAANAPLRIVSTDFERFYPAAVLGRQKLTPAMDMMMAARCVSYLLGEHDGELPSGVPPEFAELLHRVGYDDAGSDTDPWALHRELGTLGKSLFGPPAFHPISMT